MKVLFIHQNFPGQFVHLAGRLAAARANTVWALTMHANPAPAGVRLRPYTLLREAAPQTHPMLRDQEAKVMRAEACAAAALDLARSGFVPDIIVAHPGWGEAMFIKDVFPRARLVLYCEYYYALEGQDVGFDPELAPLTFEQKCQLRLKNSANLLSMEIADAAVSPTHWQRSTYPAWAREKISVIHDGIDQARLAPNPQARVRLAPGAGHDGIALRPGDEVLTYVARNLEPVRGFQVFMRALPELLRRRPQLQVLVVGGDAVSYGQHAPDGLSWRAHLMREVGAGIDPARVHFLGQLPYQSYLDVLGVSRVHAYWTTPFVLSWSMLEAALAGVPVLASATAPVTEFAERLDIATMPFFDVGAICDALAERLARPPEARRARPDDALSLQHCVSAQLALLSAL